MASLIFSLTKLTLFARSIYLIRGFPRRRLKYRANLGSLEKFLLKLYSKLLKSKQPDPNIHYLYKTFRNWVVKDLKDSKSKYFNQYFSLNKCNIQKLWPGIRSIINVDKCKNSYITSISNNNKCVDNPNDIANIFNNFFANIGKTAEKGIPRGSHIPSFYLLSLRVVALPNSFLAI